MKSIKWDEVHGEDIVKKREELVCHSCGKRVHRKNNDVTIPEGWNMDYFGYGFTYWYCPDCLPKKSENSIIICGQSCTKIGTNKYGTVYLLDNPLFYSKYGDGRNVYYWKQSEVYKRLVESDFFHNLCKEYHENFYIGLLNNEMYEKFKDNIPGFDDEWWTNMTDDWSDYITYEQYYISITGEVRQGCTKGIRAVRPYVVLRENN